MFCDLSDKLVLVTGGTRGIGLACALAFAGRGAKTVLTCRWGCDDEEALRGRFMDIGAPEPLIVQADVSSSEDTDQLMEELINLDMPVEVFLSNATGAVSVSSLDDLTERAMMSTMRYSVWPTVEYVKKIKQTLGKWPRYVIAMSTTGIDNYTRNYDLVAASKASLEGVCRYLAYHLRNEDCRVNAIRTRAVATESLKAVIGDDLEKIASRVGAENQLLTPEDVAGAVLGLCSGYLDAMRGQTLVVDKGGLFSDNISRLACERKRLGL